MHAGEGLDGVMESVAPPAAVTEDRVVPQAADDVFHPGTDSAVLGIVVLPGLGRGGPGRLRVAPPFRS